MSAQNLFVPDTSRTKGIEISFRYLKHANGLLYFHSKKPEFLKQEIYANLILYNFGIFLANEAAEENLKKKRKKGNKYNYEIDFSSALKTARKFFVRRDSHKHVDIIKLMMKYVHAVKIEFRQFDRPLRKRSITSTLTNARPLTWPAVLASPVCEFCLAASVTMEADLPEMTGRFDPNIWVAQ